ncbi:hypothetical protein K438DRAFT_1635177, partial [Mycena galopus ATCC 62051]
FPHIVNLACKAVLGSITNMKFAASDAGNFVPPAGEAILALTHYQIRASSLRRQYFSEVLKALKQKDLQLLRSERSDTRWSSTLLMIERAVLLREAIDELLSDDQFGDLQKYKLGNEEWNALEAFQRILAVPHAFQQRLSSETTPTLGNAIPSFEAMIKAWEKEQTEHPETADIVQKGIDKLGTYHERVEDVPVYVLAMREPDYP